LEPLCGVIILKKKLRRNHTHLSLHVQLATTHIYLSNQRIYLSTRMQQPYLLFHLTPRAGRWIPSHSFLLLRLRFLKASVLRFWPESEVRPLPASEVRPFILHVSFCFPKKSTSTTSCVGSDGMMASCTANDGSFLQELRVNHLHELRGDGSTTTSMASSCDLDGLLLRDLDRARPDPGAPLPGGSCTMAPITMATAAMAAPPRRHQRDMALFFLFSKIIFFVLVHLRN
jgi:hypothetical protein